MFPGDFHFLRPLWFLALLPAGLLVLAIWAAQLRESGWERAISGALLPHLLEGRAGARQRWPAWLLLIAWLLASISLAGPVWKKLPQAVQHKEDGLVIIQDLSLSLYVQDLSPNRLTRARHKLLDILKSRQEGLTALVVYSGDAHVVCPLTDDTATIAAMVPDLEPGIMPSYGSNLAAAVELALRLCRDSSLSRGRLLLLTDEVAPEMASDVTKLLRGQDFTISILGVGTAAGGPISKGDSGFLQDERGNIVIPRLDGGELAKFAAANGGRYSEIRIDDGDFNYLLGGAPVLPREEEYRPVERKFDQWREDGYWLLLALLPLALLAFRRGWLIAALLLAVLLPARPSQAMEWRDLWLRRDQQAARAPAEYRVGNYAAAAENFAKVDTAEAHYNRGNSLAQLGKLEEALQAYDQALKIDPNLADAQFNRQLVGDMLRQQKQPQNQVQKPDKSGQNQAGQNDQQAGGNQGQKPNGAGKDQPGQAGGQGENGQSDPPGKPGEAAKNGQKANGAQGGAEPRQNNAASQAGDEKGGAEQKNPRGMMGKPSPAGQKGMEKPNAALDSMNPEQQQELEQRLRQVPDNPGGLLRRKFEYQFQNNRQRGAGGSGKIW